ncbi:MAG TPA: hypothetical protein VJ885_14085 [Thermoanaerobaculia bacterium]|nr:hypothetical protein [Thermoanaerobaculia bacterium]
MQGGSDGPPSIRPFTAGQLAGWLCKALPTKDGGKISRILFEGKVPGEVNDGGCPRS